MRRCVFLGFGAVSHATFPLVTQLFDEIIKEYVILDVRRPDVLPDTKGKPIKLIEATLSEENISEVLGKYIEDGDMVFDFTVCVDTISVVLEIGKKKNTVFISASIEEWLGKEFPNQIELYNHLYEIAPTVKYTAVVDVGANPGMITHFCVLGLFSMAKNAIKRGVPDAAKLQELLDKKAVPQLITALGIDVIHCSEKEDMTPAHPETLEGTAVNSWAVAAFQEEWVAPGEVCAGTKDIPALTKPGFTVIANDDPKVVQTPFPMHLKVANPREIFIGRLVRHPETLELSKLFYDPETGHVPTTGFVYQPSKIARDFYRKEGWENFPRMCMTEVNAGPLSGYESMGALLISSREDIPMHYYGSIVTCEQSREVGCMVNPTILQVAAGAVAHMSLALKTPGMGVVMAKDFDSEEIMNIARPYLGTVLDEDLEFRLPTAWEELVSDEAL